MNKNPTIGEAIADKVLPIIASPSFQSWMIDQDRDAFKYDPPLDPRTERKNAGGDHGKNRAAFRAGIWAQRYPFLQDETINPMIAEALKIGEIEDVLNAITKGAIAAKSPPPKTVFARHVATAMHVASTIMRLEKRIPTKGEIRDLTKEMFAKKGWDHFRIEPQRWTEIFTAAHLSDLPRDAPKRGLTKHGSK